VHSLDTNTARHEQSHRPDVLARQPSFIAAAFGDTYMAKSGSASSLLLLRLSGVEPLQFFREKHIMDAQFFKVAGLLIPETKILQISPSGLGIRSCYQRTVQTKFRQQAAIPFFRMNLSLCDLQ